MAKLTYVLLYNPLEIKDAITSIQYYVILGQIITFISRYYPHNSRKINWSMSIPYLWLRIDKDQKGHVTPNIIIIYDNLFFYVFKGHIYFLIVNIMSMLL